MPPKPKLDPKKRKQRMMLIGAAAVGVLFLLYMRSRSAAAQGTTTAATDPNAIDQAAQAAAQQQAASDEALNASSIPYQFSGGSGTGGGFDTGGGSVQPGPPITVNVTVPGSGSGSTNTVHTPSTPTQKPLTTNGALRAPSGPKKPPAKAGYNVRGLGGGAWEYVPVPVTKPTGSNSHKPPKKRSAGGVVHGK